MNDVLASTTQAPLSTRVSQVLGTSFTDYGLREALESLDNNQFVENSHASRRQLRQRFESQSIKDAGDVLEHYLKVAQVSTPSNWSLKTETLNVLRSNVRDIRSSCSTMQAHVKAASLQITRAIGEADLVQSRKEHINRKHAILTSFENCFLLPEEQVVLLTSSLEPVDARFFLAFEAVRKIHSNCQSLLTTDNNKAG
jgi:conserved oligomeric Golgi complex subunit 6